MTALLRLPAEQTYAPELAALARGDDGQRPEGWTLSPKAVLTYLMGGEAADGTPITPKYVGSRRLIETAVATLATDRALLLLGVPGTAKTWVSEHLAAAIAGDSTTLVQCTAGTDENQIRYGWNYALLLAKGPSEAALVPTPLYRAMQDGKLCRLEELTRMGSDVQDTLRPHTASMSARGEPRGAAYSGRRVSLQDAAETLLIMTPPPGCGGDCPVNVTP